MSGEQAAYLLQHANDCEAQAKRARELAAELTRMGDPIGEGVLAVAKALSRHGLCVVHRNALMRIRTAIDSIRWDDSDHPFEVRHECETLLAAIDQSLNPPSRPI